MDRETNGRQFGAPIGPIKSQEGESAGWRSNRVSDGIPGKEGRHYSYSEAGCHAVGNGNVMTG